MLGALNAIVRPPTLCAVIALCSCHHRHARFIDDGFEGRPDQGTLPGEDGDEDDPPPPKRHLPAARLQPEPMLAVAALAPTVRMPWPLVELPSTQPHLDVAMARDTCDPEGLKRAIHADVHAYVVAWCRIRKGDTAAVDALAPLATAARADVMRAARLDVIDLVANANSASAAIARLAELHLEAIDNLDVLAATYGALGQPADAAYVANAIAALDPKPTTTIECERLLARGVVGADLATRLAHVNEPVPGCPRRAAALACALRSAWRGRRADLGARLVAMRECFNELSDDPDRDAKLELILVHARWRELQWTRWIELGRHAVVAGASGEDLAVTALDNAALASDCEPDAIAAVIADATKLAAMPWHQSRLDVVLAPLQQLTAERCAALHSTPAK